jgi:hypothetical protein
MHFRKCRVRKLVQTLLGLAILIATTADSFGQFQYPTQPSQAAPPVRQQIAAAQAPVALAQANERDQDVAKVDQDRRDRAFIYSALMFVAAAVAALASLQLATFLIMARTTRTQLRAYVQVHGAKIFNAADETGGPVIAHLYIKNFGQTPAYKVMNASAFAFEKNPAASTRNPAISDKEFTAPGRNKIELAPGQSEDMIEIARRPPLSVQERRALMDGDMAIFVYGEIRFTDVFGQRQSSRYRYMLGGPDGIRPGGSLIACGEGDEAA